MTPSSYLDSRRSRSKYRKQSIPIFSRKASRARRPFRVQSKEAEIVLKVKIKKIFRIPRVYLTDIFPNIARQSLPDERDSVKYCEFKDFGEYEYKNNLREGDYVIIFEDISEAIFSLTVSYKEYPLSRLYELGLVLLEIGSTLFIASFIPQS